MDIVNTLDTVGNNRFARVKASGPTIYKCHVPLLFLHFWFFKSNFLIPKRVKIFFYTGLPDF